MRYIFKQDSANPLAVVLEGQAGDKTSSFVAEGLEYVCLDFSDYGSVSNIPLTELYLLTED